MTEHEKLKEICDTIGYESNFVYDNDGFGNNAPGLGYGVWNFSGFEQIDVREIIMTGDFMKKYFDYMRYSLNMDLHRNLKADMFDHLDNPIDYLYNLIK